MVQGFVPDYSQIRGAMKLPLKPYAADTAIPSGPILGVRVAGPLISDVERSEPSFQRTASGHRERHCH